MEQLTVKCETGETLNMQVRTDDESVWLTPQQMADLFGVRKAAIERHIRSIFAVRELTPSANVRDDDYDDYPEACFNLDMVVSVGYRINSMRGVRVRQWAAGMLESRRAAVAAAA